jgi:uncharacterized protein (DUF433 family)
MSLHVGILEREMRKQELLDRIALDPRIMAGQPCIRGTRLTVHHILNVLAFGTTVDELLEEYDGLAREDIAACLLFASESLASTSFVPLAASAI